MLSHYVASSESDLLKLKYSAVLTLAVPCGTWKAETNEWVSRTELHRILCPDPYWSGFARTLERGAYVEIEGELHFSQDDLPVVIQGESFNMKRSVYGVQATQIRKLDYPPIGAEERDDS
jgi:hypothetical protein